MAAVPIAMKSTAESADKLTELLWQDALRHLESTNNEVLLPTNVIDMIGQDNVDKIKSRLCALIGASVVAFIDESINALRIMRTPTFSGSAVSVASHDEISNFKKEAASGSSKVRGKSAVPTKTTKVPRPPNAFILYRQHHHPKIREAYPDFCNNDISIMLGKQWKAEPDEVKIHFRNLAIQLKKKHAEDHPDYQYTPRKPSEKKRRASSRQHPKHTQSGMVLQSPTSTNGASNAPTPTMYPGIQVSDVDFNGGMDGVTGLNAILNPTDVPEEQQFYFDTDAFDLLQQVHQEYNKSTLYQFNFAEQPVGESFEFPDFMADCY